MSTTEITVQQVVIKSEQVNRVYAGRVGKCCCGCSGTYSESKMGVTRMLNKAKAAVGVKVSDGVIGERLAQWTVGERLYIIYFKA